PQNLSIEAFPTGACSRTILGKSEIIIHRETPDRFRIECWRSFSDYVWNFMVDAGKSAKI
ncbi:MAG: sarcosine oxidase subunit gamma family protein, partial [Rhizobiaceae bacterium]